MIAAVPAQAADGDATAGAKPIQPLYGNIRSFYGNIRSFSGDINPFYGNIRSFWGDTSPFDGNLTAFWGNIRSFSDTSVDGVTPAWGNIRSFWGDFGPAWGNVSSFWGNIRSFDAAPGDYTTLASQIDGLVNQSEATWGAVVQAKTGKSFRDGFANGVLAKYGIDLSNPATLASITPEQRTLFMLDWYDGLMEYSGVDHVDHWMKTANWTPSLTIVQGQGRRSVIGLLDFSVNDAGTAKTITQFDGTSTFSNGHGAAVASLMVAAHDGKGVMGIAPMATVLAYNPFDATGTASWSDVSDGVLKLSSSGASIINMSLGVSGWTFNPGWNTVFSNPLVAAATKNSLFVIAAGNDGITQTQNVAWNFQTNPNFIIVGSVDPSGQISSFSNKPGSACLTDAKGNCGPGNQLKNRFIVAPGELILVADDKGGVTRLSGTSFAAPLVSGTIALVQNRWPWLANYPKETADIILKSAKDLGTPGVDDVYGVGLLDATAANSPLSFDKLIFYSQDDKGQTKPQSATQVRTAGVQTSWESKSMFFYAFEAIGGTYRDFAIPLSTKLIGQTVLTAAGSREQFQQYLYSRMTDWMKTATAPGKPGPGFASFTDYGAPVSNPYGYNITMSLAPRTVMPGFRQSTMPYQTSLRLAGPEDRFAVRMGFGDGAIALGGHDGFALVSDYDSEVGGANPLLGMASGGGYASAEMALSPKLRVATGVTQRTLRRDLTGRSFQEQVALGGVAPYEAGAQMLTIRYQADPRLTLTAGYTRLHEASALLGVQSVDPADFRDGSTTNGATLGAEAQITGDLRLSVSGTFGRTASDTAQNLAVSKGGLISTAYEVAVAKERVFDGHDRARLTLSQPMFVEHGSIDLTQIAVVDRQTGELGPVTQSFDVSQTKRQYVAEMLYARALMNGAAEMSLFGRAQLRPSATAQDSAALMAGTRFRLNF